MAGTPANDLNIQMPGIVIFDGISTFLGRTLIAGTGISISNGNGISGNPIISNTGLSSISITGDTGGALTGAAFIFGATASAGSSTSFSGSGSTISLNVTDSGSNVLIGNSTGNGTLTGTANTGLGVAVLHGLTSGVNNVCVGYSSGQLITTGNHNASVGTSSLASLHTGTFNLTLGDTAGGNYTSSESSNILLNNSGTLGESHVLRIGLSTGTGNGMLNKAFISGINGVTSSNPLMVTINSATDQLGIAAIPAGAPITPYIVGSTGNYATIALAITQAVADGASTGTPKIIYIQPGTYNVNVAMKDGIYLSGLASSSQFSPLLNFVNITGVFTFASAGVNCNYGLQNLTITNQAKTTFQFTSTGAETPGLILDNVNFVYNDDVTNPSYFVSETGGASANYNIIVQNCNLKDNTSTNLAYLCSSFVDSCKISFFGSNFILFSSFFPAITFTAQSFTVTVQKDSNVGIAFDCVNGRFQDFRNCQISGSFKAYGSGSTLAAYNCDLSNMTVVNVGSTTDVLLRQSLISQANFTGAYDSLNCYDSSGVLVQSFVNNKNPPVGNYTTTNQDVHVGVDTTAARTITLGNQQPALGQVLTIADVQGLANTNPITIDGNGVNINGAATYTINTSYGSVILTQVETNSSTIWSIS